MRKNFSLKIIILAIVVVLGIICMIPAYVLANTNETTYTITLEAPKPYDSQKTDISKMAESVDMEELEEYLSEQLKKCSDTINVSEFKLPADRETMQAIATLIAEGIPEAFHVDGSFSVTHNGTHIIDIVVTYLYTADEYKQMYEACEEVAEELLDGIIGNKNLSDVEKALLIHDRLAILCEYDFGNAENRFDMYGALVNRVSVCQGYAEAYEYLLEEVGIDSYICSSKALYHAWNIVSINGKWYHVDVTWDDYAWQVGERGAEGVVVHDNFLRSSDGIYATGHEATDYDTTPSDTTYDHYFWQNSQTGFQLIGNEIYYIDNTTQSLNRYSDKAVLHSVADWWLYQQTMHWGNNARLSSDGTNLLYSLAEGVYQYNVKTGESKEIYSPNRIGDTYIYGLAYKDGYLVCDLNDRPPYAEGAMTNLYQLKEAYTVPDATVLIGDVNSDGEVNNLDRATLTRYLANWAEYTEDKINKEAADVNCDGEVNNLDRAILTRHLANWEEYKELPYLKN